jgi:Tol biopolymer transport system component
MKHRRYSFSPLWPLFYSLPLLLAACTISPGAPASPSSALPVTQPPRAATLTAIEMPSLTFPTPTITQNSSPTTALKLTPPPLEGVIVFTTKSELYKYDMSTADVQLISQGSIFAPSVASNGYIFFLSGGFAKATQIYRTNLDGSGLQQMTFDPVYKTDLAISPDGSQVAYISGNHPINETLYLTSSSHFTFINSTPFQSEIVSTSWSPDNKKIAFISVNPELDPKDQSGDLFILDAGGTSLTQITSGLRVYAYDHPAWSPDSDLLAVPIQQSGVTQLFIVDLSTHALTQLTHSISDIRGPAWSPDGRKILFTQNGKLCFINRDGSNLTILSDDMADSYIGEGPRNIWSPDGQYIAFVRDDYQSEDLFLVSINGGTPQRLAADFSFDNVANLSWVIPQNR